MDAATPAEKPPVKTLEQWLTQLTPKQLQFLHALPEHNWQAWKTCRILKFGKATLSEWQQEEAFSTARQILEQRFLDAISASPARVSMELTHVAYSDVRDFLGPDGRPLPPSEWPDEAAAAVASVEVETRFEGQGPDRTAYTLTKFKLHPKLEAAKMLLALEGKLVERHEVTGKNGAPLNASPSVIYIGGPPEPGEPSGTDAG